MSITQLMTFGISGITFTGADIPGFDREASEEIFILFY